MTPSLRTDVAANARTWPTDAVSSAQCQHDVINADGVKVNAPCRLRRRKFWKFDYEVVHSEVYLNKYVVSMAPFSTPSCLTSHHSYHFIPTFHSENCCSFACFRFLIFHNFFQGGSGDPICPYVRTPMDGVAAVGGGQTWNCVIGSPGQLVIWVVFHVRVTESSFDPVWDPSFSGFRKNAQNSKRTFEMLKWQKSLSGVCCWTEITGCQSMQWTFSFTYDY